MDDERFARTRAEQLAARGSGDALIRTTSSGAGSRQTQIEAALAALEPERERAARLVEQRGPERQDGSVPGLARASAPDALEGVVAAGRLRSDRIEQCFHSTFCLHKRIFPKLLKPWTLRITPNRSIQRTPGRTLPARP